MNDPPVAVNDHYTVGRGETIVVPPIDGLLRNDWDPDGDSVEVAGFSYPSHGTITDIYTDGRFTYTHDGSSGTTDSFTYTISDGEAVSGSATVDFTVVQTGDVRVSLEWWSDADMDLHVTDPFGETVSYLNPSTPSGGELDIDANAGCTSTTSSPVESIFWPTAAAPTGQYVVEVHYYGECLGEGVESVRVTTRVDGVLQFYDRSLSPGQWLEVVTFSR